MKKATLLLLLLPFIALQLVAQKPDDNKIDFEYQQLPLKPLDKNIKGYVSEFVISNEQDLLKLKEESLIEYDKKMAEYQQNKANAQADYDYKINHWDEYVDAAKKEHEIALAAYNETLESMNLIERLAYRETNKPPVFVMPRKPTAPTHYYEPTYTAPKELEILDKKEVILSTYLRIEGYKPVDNGGVYIKATLYPFEAKQPVSETTQERYYDSSSKTYKTRSVTTVTISAKYPIALEVVDKLNNTVLLNTVIGGEYVGFINSSNPVIEKDLLDKNLKAVKALLDNNYGFATVTRNTILYTIKPKKFEYPEYQSAFEKAMSFYNTLKYPDQDLSASMREAIALWEQALTEYVPNDSKARIDEDVVRATYYNLAEAYLWLNDFDKANQYLTKLFAFKLKDSEKKGIDSFKDFINDQKERYLANK